MSAFVVCVVAVVGAAVLGRPELAVLLFIAYLVALIATHLGVPMPWEKK